jgi:hypothetical protein
MNQNSKSKKRRVFWTYKKLIKLSEKTMIKYYSPEMVARISELTLTECEGIIERLPYIGGRKNIFTPIIEFVGLLICFYMAMKKEGIEAVVSVYIAIEIVEKLINKVPRFIGLILGKLSFTNMGINFFKKLTAPTLKKIYPEDFVCNVAIIKKDKKEIEYEFEFSECGVHKLFEAEGAQELKPYCNFFDPLLSTRFEMGIDSNHTFAQKCSTCKLNYNNKRKTHTPDNIANMMKEAEVILNIKKV